MLYHNVQVMAYSLRVIDASAVVIASSAAIWFGIDPAVRANPAILAGTALFALSLFIAFLVVAERMHVYFARRTEDLSTELLALAETALYATGLACIATQVIGAELPGQSYLRALAAVVLTLVGMRFAMRFVVRRLRRRGDDYRVWLIVGQNERAADLAEAILANPHFGIRIEEIIDIAADGVGSPPHERFLQAPLSGVRRRVVTEAAAVRQIVATHVIDEVVVTLPVRSCYDKVSQVLDICSEAGISMKFGPEVFEKAGFFTQVAHVGSIPLVTHYNGPSNYRLLMVKRFIDLVGATAGLLVLAPLMVGIALAVKLTSRGPVLFAQTRMGLHGRHFEMLKFRSMVEDAPRLREQFLEHLNEQGGTAFKIRNDMRITRVGRWLRKHHLDELPQLWNVFVGDMSLVGPRPFPVKQTQGWEWWQRRRLTMPPGLTCHWQLEDDPTQPFSRWMELDMAYIDRWSLWLDLKIIARTFGAVVRGNGW